MTTDIQCIALDCFGTTFKADTLSYDTIYKYNEHVKQQKFQPYHFDEEWYQLKIFEDVAEGFKELRRLKIKIVALSNGSIDLIKTLSDANEIAWDQIIDLVKHRVYKPHLKAYKACIIDTKIPASNTLMVTANKSFGDIECASKIGMQTCLIRNGTPNTILELAESLGDSMQLAR